MTDRPASWFIKWLGKQENSSSKSYTQCAKVLREAGETKKADKIIWENFENIRSKMKRIDKARWVGMSLQKYFLGYKLGWRFLVVPLCWTIPVLVAGACIGFYSPESFANKYQLMWAYGQNPQAAIKGPGFWWCFGLSLDRLVPLVQFSKDYTDTIFNGWQRYWFMGQSLFGWFMAIVIGTSVRRATKRRESD